MDDPRLVCWHSFEPGVASFGLDGVITGLGLQVFGADFARLEPPQRLETVKRLLAQYRGLLVWDNFETVHEMPDPAGATPPLDEAGCAALRGFLEWVRDQSRSVVLITSRAQEGWLGEVRRIGVGGLNRQEAAEYAGHLLAEARQQPGQALEWIVRCVTLFGQFPHPLTGPGPQHLARLTRQLGIPALEQTWQQVTGNPLPPAVCDYLTSHPGPEPGGQP